METIAPSSTVRVGSLPLPPGRVGVVPADPLVELSGQATDHVLVADVGIAKAPRRQAADLTAGLEHDDALSLPPYLHGRCHRVSSGPTPEQRPPVTIDSPAEVPLTVLSFAERRSRTSVIETAHVHQIWRALKTIDAQLGIRSLDGCDLGRICLGLTIPQAMPY